LGFRDTFSFALTSLLAHLYTHFTEQVAGPRSPQSLPDFTIVATHTLLGRIPLFSNPVQPNSRTTRLIGAL
jgi:hypothetical protein